MTDLRISSGTLRTIIEQLRDAGVVPERATEADLKPEWLSALPAIPKAEILAQIRRGEVELPSGIDGQLRLRMPQEQWDKLPPAPQLRIPLGSARKDQYTRDDWTKAVGVEIENTKEYLGHVNQLDTAHTTRMTSIQMVITQLETSVLKNLLPDLSGEALERAARLTGFAELDPLDFLRAYDSEDAEVEQQLREIEGDSAFRDREILRHPITGTLIERSKDLQESVNALKAWFRKFDRIGQSQAGGGLKELLVQSYGTDAYVKPHWLWEWGKASQHTADGNAIVELARVGDPEIHDFESFLRVHTAKKESLRTLETSMIEVKGEIQAGEKLEKRHNDLSRKREGLREVHHKKATEGLLAHLRVTLFDGKESLPGDRSGDRSGDPALERALKQWSGLVHQKHYLTEYRNEHVGQLRTTLTTKQARLQKLKKKINHPKALKRPAVPTKEQFEKAYGGAFERSTQRSLGTYSARYNRIYGFNDYDRGSLLADFLWWDLITDGQIDGNFIQEVAEFRGSHTDYSWNPAPTDDDARDDGVNAVEDAAADRAEEDAAAESAEADADADADTDLGGDES